MLSDPIAAIATPPGRSAVALIRLSGDGAHAIAARVLRPFAADPARMARRAAAVHPTSGERLDEVLYTVYVAPSSYTGEDAVEIGTHGGLLAPVEVLGALLAAGAREAHPGEFTRRALANGRIDLLQAEATADLVDATAPAQRRAALEQMDRGLSQRIASLRARVLELEALISYDIDFPEEDDGPVPPARVRDALATLEASLEAMLQVAGEGERLREGALCVIAGAPNVGKSSLFNALLGAERAIVTEIPGTTRDAIEAHAVCGGFPFRLVDTAGLRDSDDRVERLGVEVSRRYVGRADVVLFCVEAGREMRPAERAFLREPVAPVVLVRTKADLFEGDGGEGIPVAALAGHGLQAVRDELARVAFQTLSRTADLGPVLTRARHRTAVERALGEIREFAHARAAGLEGAVAATHLRSAVTALEDVIGLVTTEDVLDRVFAAFCIGK